LAYVEEKAFVQQLDACYQVTWHYYDKNKQIRKTSITLKNEDIKSFMASPSNICGEVVILRAYQEKTWAVTDILPSGAPYSTPLDVCPSSNLGNNHIRLILDNGAWDFIISETQKDVLQWTRANGVKVKIQLLNDNNRFSLSINLSDYPELISGTFHGQATSPHSIVGLIRTNSPNKTVDVKSCIKKIALFYAAGLHHVENCSQVEFDVEAKWDSLSYMYVVTKIMPLLTDGETEFILSSVAYENARTILLLESQNPKHKGLVFSCLYGEKCATIRKYIPSKSSRILVNTNTTYEHEKQKVYCKSFTQPDVQEVSAYIRRIPCEKENKDRKETRFEISISNIEDGCFVLEDSIDFPPFIELTEQCCPVLMPVKFNPKFPRVLLELKEGFSFRGLFECKGWADDKEDSYRFFFHEAGYAITCLVSFKELLRAGLVDFDFRTKLELHLVLHGEEYESNPYQKHQAKKEINAKKNLYFRINAIFGNVFNQADTGTFEQKVTPLTEWSPYIVRDVELPGFYNFGALVAINLSCGITCMLPISASILTRSGHYNWRTNDILRVKYSIFKQSVAPFFKLSCIAIEPRMDLDDELSTISVKLKSPPTNDSLYYQFEALSGGENTLHGGTIVKFRHGKRKLNFDIDDPRIKTAELQVFVARWRDEYYLQKIVKIKFDSHENK
jgi:hypothetical protein